MKGLVSIIIVSTNEYALLRSCINSIRASDCHLIKEVIVIDNASTDETASYLRKIRAQFSIKSVKNLSRIGFAKNCNIGIMKATGAFVLLLNPDVNLQPTAISTLCAFMTMHKNAGICAPQLLNRDGTLQYSCRRFPTWKSFLVRRTPLRILLKNGQSNNRHLMKEVDHTIERKIDWALGGCLFIRKELLLSVGLLDERFFLYVDDIDLCLRAWRRGWTVWYVPKAKAYHLHKAMSDKRLFSTYSLRHFCSIIHFVWKHGVVVKRT